MNTSKLFQAFFYMVVLILMIFPNCALAAKPVCGDGICKGNEKTSCPKDCTGGDDSTDAPSSYNLARASFNDFGGLGVGNGGISADGEGFCTIDRDGNPETDDDVVTYDYWAWQEALLSDEENIHKLDPSKECKEFNNRSDVSGGGRWFLITTAGPVEQYVVERWLVFDFSDEVEFNIDEDLWIPVGEGDLCPDLDGSGGLGNIYVGKHPSPNANPCVDNLTVRFPADRILKNNATTQDFAISIRHQPGDQYWPPWGELRYLEPLYIRAPSAEGVFVGRDCTVMSTRPAPTAPHDRMVAELYSWNSPSSSEFIANYNMPLEVCVIRTSE
jgi:hypothetical protein